MHQLVRLAREAVRKYILDGVTITPPDYIDDEYKKNSAGVFVSLKKDGRLRGCIGTFIPVMDCIAEEVIKNAISSATQDPRFQPVTAEELEDIAFSVDILSLPEKVDSVDGLDHRKYGIIVVSGYKKGLLLPDLEGVNSVDEQLQIAKAKAGIMPGEDIEIFRFEVKRYK
ncbi:hypothetical protein BMS3Abin07_01314 [bacterium BMS3Abin07]|nr:hypothetical protein BMS3Abin07_01314 [bacterium BMS3Abin07]GBE33158.1 hypothetical protein BMS3Bbin05_02096 [bacterium BMS3Bbin05]HDL21178.1 AmmeMemoRadiSam system protein A [Nitrospirota bacterium]HDO22642.1 AmmeMemoRadiSam system protein A [Nitrospirota bacterium]HDZ87646.1 AmmeMemoRadiSam system protein A [Nitrospirota bacterium]